ncbi:hypothetical protein DM860_011777 [Cuscuta australis]|uniref:Uncharacterized protein n=1 Tax=Cuscuta australis TaxID=267555 RepID=A0A328DGY1_9ASTE|nr:hypothetical protein DM860_011777 [Cuscuta australis]
MPFSIILGNRTSASSTILSLHKESITVL